MGGVTAPIPNRTQPIICKNGAEVAGMYRELTNGLGIDTIVSRANQRVQGGTNGCGRAPTPALVTIISEGVRGLANGARDVIFSTNKKIMTSKEKAREIVNEFHNESHPHGWGLAKQLALTHVNNVLGVPGTFKFGMLEQIFWEKVRNEIFKIKL